MKKISFIAVILLFIYVCSWFVASSRLQALLNSQLNKQNNHNYILFDAVEISGFPLHFIIKFNNVELRNPLILDSSVQLNLPSLVIDFSIFGRNVYVNIPKSFDCLLRSKLFSNSYLVNYNYLPSIEFNLFDTLIWSIFKRRYVGNIIAQFSYSDKGYDIVDKKNNQLILRSKANKFLYTGTKIENSLISAKINMNASSKLLNNNDKSYSALNSQISFKHGHKHNIRGDIDYFTVSSDKFKVNLGGNFILDNSKLSYKLLVKLYNHNYLLQLVSLNYTRLNIQVIREILLFLGHKSFDNNRKPYIRFQIDKSSDGSILIGNMRLKDILLYYGTKVSVDYFMR